MLTLLPGRNKYRLYIAYYPRGAQSPSDVLFHTGLLLVPKEPKSREKASSWRYHATTAILGDQQQWVYESSAVKNRTVRLHVVLLLGKVSSDVTGETLDELLREVPVANYLPTWRCRHWVWDAIQLMINNNILHLDGMDPKVVWQNGINYASQLEYDWNVALSTCDLQGNAITSEIP